ncbi:MAG: hypothetical protein PHU85_19545, partial [Phycisphaerae bacterium]|nr:hypothetical protein [Phycisphaerae bacterium]
VAPSSVNMRSGGTTPLTVYALRRDGFDGDITLSLKEPAGGITLAGGTIPGGQDQVRVTLTAPTAGLREPGKLTLEGRSTIAGQPAVRVATPAENMMQAFAYWHLVPSERLAAAVIGRGQQRGSASILSATPVKIPAGGTARVTTNLPTRTLFGLIEFDLSEPPDGITIQDVTSDGFVSQIILHADAAKAKPGLRSNLIVNVSLTPPAPTSQPATQPAAAAAKPTTQPAAAPRPAARRRPIGTLPAIPFEVVLPR